MFYAAVRAPSSRGALPVRSGIPYVIFCNHKPLQHHHPVTFSHSYQSYKHRSPVASAREASFSMPSAEALERPKRPWLHHQVSVAAVVIMRYERMWKSEHTIAAPETKRLENGCLSAVRPRLHEPVWQQSCRLSRTAAQGHTNSEVKTHSLSSLSCLGA